MEMSLGLAVLYHRQLIEYVDVVERHTEEIRHRGMAKRIRPTNGRTCQGWRRDCPTKRMESRTHGPMSRRWGRCTRRGSSSL